MFDVKTGIPWFILITEAATHDVNGMDFLNYENGSFYIFDRGYIDYERLYKIHKSLAFFVTRSKINFKFKRIYSKKCDKSAGILCDQIIKLTGFYASKDFPEKLRRIKFYDQETDQTFEFITNNSVISATQIALLYKYRWRVELFFKWIKQHLKILTFWGTSENAVKTQIYIAIITYTLISIIKAQLKSDYTCYEILQILSISLLNKTTLNELVNKPSLQNFKEPNCNQLKMF